MDNRRTRNLGAFFAVAVLAATAAPVALTAVALVLGGYSAARLEAAPAAAVVNAFAERAHRRFRAVGLVAPLPAAWGVAFTTRNQSAHSKHRKKKIKESKPTASKHSHTRTRGE